MAFKKHNWLAYSREEKIMEIIIKEGDGRKLDFFRCNSIKEFPKIARIIKEKYGFNFESEGKEKETINFMENLNQEKRFLEKEREKERSVL